MGEVEVRSPLIFLVFILVSSTASSQSDAEILEKVRANAARIYLEQASFTLPTSFHESGLAPSDKKRLVEKWANDSAACFADALALYASTSDIPLAELVDENLTFSLDGGGPSSEFSVFLDTCLASAWEAVGTPLPK